MATLQYSHVDVKPASSADRPTIESVRLEWLTDYDADVSDLETSVMSHYGEDGANWADVPEGVKAEVVAQHGSILGACEEYARQDRERLQAFRNGEWSMVGVIAHAVVSTPAGAGSRRLQTFHSGGLWGIEDDHSQEDRRAYEAGQLHDLRDHLESFGVDTANLFELAGIPEDHATL